MSVPMPSADAQVGKLQFFIAPKNLPGPRRSSACQNPKICCLRADLLFKPNQSAAQALRAILKEIVAITLFFSLHLIKHFLLSLCLRTGTNPTRCFCISNLFNFLTLNADFRISRMDNKAYIFQWYMSQPNWERYICRGCLKKMKITAIKVMMNCWRGRNTGTFRWLTIIFYVIHLD